jgi:hypothetical protein
MLKHGIKSMRLVPVKRNYAFEDPAIPTREQWVIKVLSGTGRSRKGEARGVARGGGVGGGAPKGLLDQSLDLRVRQQKCVMLCAFLPSPACTLIIPANRTSGQTN